MFQLVAPDENNVSNLKALESAVEHRSVKGNDYTFAFEIALAYNNLGQTDKALEWLERAAAANSHSFAYIAVEPRFANLRDLQRFQHLARKFEASDNQ
jgi:tetratricopeptide (TPR) repeat protein